ncbi:MAG: serine hydrolase domain-containing protein [Myxococcota bacterium]|jgi:CubicO group peptidase (beta-lactamase class C family)
MGTGSRSVWVFPVLFFSMVAGCSSVEGGSDSGPDGGGGADVDTRQLDSFIAKQMASGNIPGIAVAVVKGSGSCFAKGYGWANIEKKVPATKDTLWMLASVSKTFIVTSVMQLAEAGKIGLDDNVNMHLPFAVDNPGFPAVPVTIRMLLTHKSSIRDNWDVLNALLVDGDSPIALGDFLRGYLVPGGAYYDAAKNFYPTAPGAVHKYSNIGAALAASTPGRH